MVFAAILSLYEHDYTDISQLWLVGLNLVFNVLMALTRVRSKPVGGGEDKGDKGDKRARKHYV
jgi:hypothetical protein